ncbi:MAG: AAA family ATPase [Candidatus Woesearchaeota archaeon]
MKLVEFAIESYRSCLKTKLTINDKITVLIGINGSGKTNILNGLQLLNKILDESSTIHLSQEKEIDTYNNCSIKCTLDHRGKCIPLKGVISYETDNNNNDIVRMSTIKWNLKNIDGNDRWKLFPSHLIGLRRLRQLRNRPSYLPFHERLFPKEIFNHKNEIELDLAEEIINLFSNIKYYSASQFSDPKNCPVSIELEENRLIKNYRFYSNKMHERFILDLYKSFKSNNTTYKRYLNTVNKSGLGLIDSIKFDEVTVPSSSYKVRAGGKIKRIENNRLLIVPSFTISNITLSPNQLSEGTFKTLALVYYILNDDSNLLLVEEPEVCIHHGLLNSLIELIKSQSKTKQIIFSTHSDYVLEHVNPEELVFISKSTEGDTIAKHLPKALSKNEYKALKKYLDESGNLGDYWRSGGLDNGDEN